ncbi:ATP-dependent protease La domain protein, putative isoform 2 [Hibiscus syriacus]|uniref:ATP-dependent protease La domain protein, putative isoform 2 n=1 Tax=Hibiscus syriacus TaxID=106335 RepID=A0A6A2YTI6_HIBSY|nr:ATP-dependent protease La domain protein, putative isoform 2 [Hibiscus syriacus]
MEDEVLRRQIEQILELDDEELQIEEVDSLLESSDDDCETIGGYSIDDFTSDTYLTSLHSYLGEVDDTRHRSGFWEGGAILNLPLFCLEGICSSADGEPLNLANIGTTAEIRQYFPLKDGSVNMGIRGQQRFCLRRSWVDAEGASFGEIQIIENDVPFISPRDACAKLVPLSNLRSQQMLSLNPSSCGGGNEEIDSIATSEESFESELSQTERRIHQSAIGACYVADRTDESTSSDDDYKSCESGYQSGSPSRNDSSFKGSSPSCHVKQIRNVSLGIGTKSMAHKLAGPRSRISCGAFWRYWELLEIDGISCRLCREIELLERLYYFQCKICQTVIARRTDKLVMSSDDHLGAYVNTHGDVHEVRTFRKAYGFSAQRPTIRRV